MRVGLDYRAATVAPLSGIGRQVRALERALDERDNTQLRRFTEAALAAPEREHACCPAWASPLQGLQRPQVRLRFEALFLPRALREERIELYIATANMGLPLGRKTTDQRYVLLLHDLFQLTERNHHRSHLKAQAYRLIDSLSIAWSVWRADRVWCPSQFSATETARLFPFAKGKVRVLPNLVAGLQTEPGALPPELPARFWLAVGTREPRKNMALFIDCWQRARAQSTAVPELVLIGHADDLPASLAGLPGLHWLSGLDDPQLHALYAHCECLWQPSYAEGFGLPVVEALSLGTPVALATGSALDEVAPPQSPRFDPHDPESILACLLNAAAQPLAKPDPALAQWAQRFDYPAYATRLYHLLEELTA